MIRKTLKTLAENMQNIEVQYINRGETPKHQYIAHEHKIQLHKIDVDSAQF